MQQYDIEIFKELEQNFEQEFLKYGTIVTLKKRDVLFTNGEVLNYFDIVAKGKIKSFQMNLGSAKEQTLFVYRTGDMFDTLTLLDGKPHDVLYEVIENAEVLQLPIEKVRGWLQTNEDFNRHFFPYIASQMRHTEALASDLSLYSTSERLSKLLLQNMNPQDEQYYQLLQNLSKTEIAKLLGTVRNVVERHLKELESEEIIENQRKNIYVKNVKKLLETSEQRLLN